MICVWCTENRHVLLLENLAHGLRISLEIAMFIAEWSNDVWRFAVFLCKAVESAGVCFKATDCSGFFLLGLSLDFFPDLDFGVGFTLVEGVNSLLIVWRFEALAEINFVIEVLEDVL